ncbi:hypothetical protein NM208_g11693 [Fusarium decemcellulare]|uniref:Uncharacterized protein n=1 Tax=Fusarium decemcellulare TaxID=57161 RepID=A0ACC1RUG2_9HYPO|nr:hypothetical protein NM208_g11693 [Fusarium decemcellulare]
MLFAEQLWVDITGDADQMMEPFTATNQASRELPYVSLVQFLMYFEAWLKLHEHLKCIQYIHPLRAIKRMYEADITVGAGAFTIQQNAIDEVEVRRLVLKATSQCPELRVGSRVDYFPFMMNGTGTAMPHPQDFRTCPPLSPTLPNRLSSAKN